MPLRKSLKAFTDRYGQLTIGANQFVNSGHYPSSKHFLTVRVSPLNNALCITSLSFGTIALIIDHQTFQKTRQSTQSIHLLS
jgi:hypothetical protein